MPTATLFAALGAALGAVFALLASRKAAGRCAAAEARSAAAEARLSQTESALQAALAAKDAASTKAAALEARLEAASARLEEQAAFVQAVKEEMQTAFGRLASQTLETNAERFGDAQRARLADLLKPFKEQLDGFKADVSQKFTQEVADRNLLRGELSKLMEFSGTLSKQTEALTTALSAQAREQGAFGEDILETILVNAGMVKGEHFHTQYAGTNERGERIRPDVILHCPDGRRIVVDSKVSLTAYVRYCNDCATLDEQKTAARDVHQSFKAHIDGLSAKAYETLKGPGGEVADFVLMFTPVEGAFTVATMHDAELRHYAFRKKVFLVTPGNLLLVVKLITDLWHKDAVNRDAQRIAERALNLYNKACGFLESFEAAGKALDGAKAAWNEAATRLTGHGGLVRQGEMLKPLLPGGKAKAIPESLRAEPEPLADILPEGTRLSD